MRRGGEGERNGRREMEESERVAGEVDGERDHQPRKQKRQEKRISPERDTALLTP